MNILQICSYNAPYAGNFIHSLKALDKKLKYYGYTTIYAFPKESMDKEWCKELQKTNKVYFLTNSRFKRKIYKELREIFKLESIDIIHSHFELYDIPLAVTKPKDCKMYWHLHDSFEENIDIIHKIIRKIHYGVISKNAYLISPSIYYKEKCVELGFNTKNSFIVDNCIDTFRINNKDEEKVYDFLMFGWSCEVKGVDLVIKACKVLEEKGYVFSIGIVGFDTTWNYIDQILKGEKLECLRKLDPVEHVNEYFNKSKVFIAASRRETFSYALCEAIYSGLKVIVSDIEGHRWSKDIPITNSFNIDNINQLIYLIENAINNNSEDIELKKESIEIIEKKYSLDQWVENIISIYLGEYK